MRLLVADDPPFVLDVGSGRRTPNDRIAPLPRGTVRVVGVGCRAAVVLADGPGEAAIYAVGRRGRAVPLGSGEHAWPAPGGDAAWIQTRRGPSCALRLMGLDGRLRRSPRQFPCATRSDPPAGKLGLVVGRTRVLDAGTGRELLRTRAGRVAAAGTNLVLQPASGRLALLDARTRREQGLLWPKRRAG